MKKKQGEIAKQKAKHNKKRLKDFGVKIVKPDDKDIQDPTKYS